MGNGVENSWRGYFSQGARATTIVVDAERLVPLEEQTGATTIRYSDWQEVGPGKWVPRQIDVVGSSAHYRTHFAWLGDAVWLAESSESIGPEGTVTLTRVQNVKVNGRESPCPRATPSNVRVRPRGRFSRCSITTARGSTEARPAPAGGRRLRRCRTRFTRSVKTSARRCVMDRNGEVAFEVAGDGQGKMKGQLGNRSIALNTGEYASSRRGARLRPRSGPHRARSRSAL